MIPGSSSLPRVAIVGRPNVGKSTLLNRMCGSRISIVEPTAGVTRDRIAVPARLDTPYGDTRTVEVIDTGGIGIVDRHDLGPHVEEQVRAALLTADLVLFVVDAREGVTPLDLEVARRLRGMERPVILVVNKVEGERVGWEVDEFRRLGIREGPFPISAQNGEGLDPLYQRIAELLPARQPGEAAAEPVLKLAVVGKRNAGKSTLINRFAREDRMLVSEVPGTTRDAVDVLFERDGERFVAIDTAGVRRRKSFDDAIDFFSDTRSYKAIRRADVVLLLFDATEPLTALDKKLARYVADHYKPMILGANKWDLVQGLVPEDYERYLDDTLPSLAYAPVSFLSGKDGFHVWETFELARELLAQAQVRVSTGELNRVVKRALEARAPTSTGFMVRVKYATQIAGAPPTIVLFVNDKRLIGKTWLRYLENRLRAELPFKEVPIHIVLRDKRGDSNVRSGSDAAIEEEPSFEG